MTSRHAAGRGRSRPALIGVFGVLVLVVALTVLARTRGPARGPIAEPNADAAAPSESRVGTVTHVANAGAPERILVDSVAPTHPVRLLFFQGRPAQPTPAGHVVALDGAGGALRFDERLRARRVRADVDGRAVASVAGAPDGGYWMVAGTGEVLRIDDRGDLLANQPGPFYYSLVASDQRGTAWLVRSPDQQGFGPPAAAEPLIVRLGPEGEPDFSVGDGVVPADFLLTHLASSGRIAVQDSVLFYVPFIRDQVVALSTTTGDTLWVSSRGLPQSTEEPRFEVVDGQALVDYAPVNLGVALGLDGRLYVLSVPGFATERGRLDALDPATGHLLRSTELDQPLPTLAVDERGRVYQLDPFALLTGVPAGERPVFQTFDLETLEGGRYTSQDIAGNVTLVNFWASWCAPCREEMPALDTLRMNIDDPEFRFITMNEDVNPAHGRAFIEAYGFDFPVLLGRGTLREAYHYVGLPATMVIDREGRIVNRWMGYAGEDQIQMIRAVIVAELNRDRSARGEAGRESPGAHSPVHNHD